mmetsp:Transcript_15054/g.38513  ORF Transcript_15054/g.38513 Transcript_15054/m.38513 type:complete len:750 (-) Transcript_15054:1461-3710(-)
MTNTHLAAELKERKAALVRDKASASKVTEQLAKSEKAVKLAKIELMELDYDEEASSKSVAEALAQRKLVEELEEAHTELSMRLGRLKFNYTPPTKGFQDSKVKGYVAKLIRVVTLEHATAIEVAAGGKLYQVVVDTDETSKLLLEKGNLRHRVTLLPLNKISGDVLDARRVSMAQQIDATADVAINLVGFDDDLQPAMKYVFGRVIICKDMNTAKSITFNRSISCKTVTLDGDVYDPSGTLSGGASKSANSSILVMVAKASKVQLELVEAQKKLAFLEKQVAELNGNKKKYQKLKENLEMREHEAALLSDRLSTTAVGSLLEQVRKLEAELGAIPVRVQELKKQVAEGEALVKEIEVSLEDTVGAREKALQRAEQQLQKLQKELVQASKFAKESAFAHEKLLVDINTLREDSTGADSDIAAMKEAVQQLEAESKELAQTVARQQEEYDVMKAKYTKECEIFEENDQEYQAVAREREQKLKTLEESQLEIQRVNHQSKQVKEKKVQGDEQMKALEKDFPWLSDEVSLEDEMEVSSADIDKARKSLDKLEREQGSKKMGINNKAMTLFEKAEQDYQDLMTKKQIMESDKMKIHQVIADLDDKKKKALKKTWEKVNKDFSSIFSTLLPGADAKLEPPEGLDVLDGLVIKVGFGGKWKDSLSELSGGQRSLIALSLILAMLRFKPAPMYILDEVDAALDLSHTQNIGQMLKKHFSNAQFIVVSLKEGMFNNANVLFQTKFVDGISTVTRTTAR